MERDTHDYREKKEGVGKPCHMGEKSRLFRRKARTQGNGAATSRARASCAARPLELLDAPR